MTEITLGGSDESGGSSSGGSLDLSDMMDQMEQAYDRLKQNPELAEMMGVDIPNMDVSEAPTDDEGQPTVTAEFLGDVCRQLEAEGFGDTTVSELAEFIENNTDMVDSMIQKNMD